MSISWPPRPSISSRMICSIFWCTRQPSGRNVQTPPVTWRTKPPRTSSLWFAASASAGSSRSVGRNSCEARAITRCPGRLLQRTEAALALPIKRPRGSSARPLTHNPWNHSVRTRLLQRNERSLGHREGRRLRHLQPFRALHAVGDPLVDLEEELVDEDVGRDLLQHAAVCIHEADVAAAGDAEVGVARLPRSVHGAAHHRDLERLRVLLQAVLDDAREALDADVVA